MQKTCMLQTWFVRPIVTTSAGSMSSCFKLLIVASMHDIAVDSNSNGSNSAQEFRGDSVTTGRLWMYKLYSMILKDIIVFCSYLWYVTNSPVPATKTKKRVELVPWSRAPTNAPRFLEPSPGGDWSNIVIKYEFAYQWQFSILMWLIQTQFNAKFFLSFASCTVQKPKLGGRTLSLWLFWKVIDFVKGVKFQWLYFLFFKDSFSTFKDLISSIWNCYHGFHFKDSFSYVSSFPKNQYFKKIDID